MIEGGGYWRGRAVALTGATGFVGHHLAGLLRRLGAEVTALVRPESPTELLRAAGVVCTPAALGDPDGLARACRGREFVFHVAGEVSFENDWGGFVRTNVRGTQNVLAATRDAGVRRLVVTSSVVAVGGTDRPRALDETADWTLGRLRVPYVTTKRRAEQLALAASDGRREVVAVNPGCVVGPDDFRKSEFGRLCQRFWRGRVPFYFGGGNNFVDVRDVALGHLRAAERGRPGERYLLTGANRSYGAFFADLARAAGRSIARFRLPTGLAIPLAALEERHRRGRAAPRLTRAQAALAGLYFYFSARKAESELGYRARPFAATVRDAHEFWTGRAA
jgi:dihydroflavonol-4-reductase